MRDEPLLLVLDEPTAALDAETEHALFERFADAARADAPTATGGSRSSSRTASHRAHGRSDRRARRRARRRGRHATKSSCAAAASTPTSTRSRPPRTADERAGHAARRRRRAALRFDAMAVTAGAIRLARACRSGRAGSREPHVGRRRGQRADGQPPPAVDGLPRRAHRRPPARGRPAPQRQRRRLVPRVGRRRRGRPARAVSRIITA